MCVYTSRQTSCGKIGHHDAFLSSTIINQMCGVCEACIEIKTYEDGEQMASLPEYISRKQYHISNRITGPFQLK